MLLGEAVGQDGRGKAPVLCISPAGFMMSPDHCWNSVALVGAPSLVVRLQSSCWEQWEDRTPLLRVSQVLEPHWLRNGKRGDLKSWNHLVWGWKWRSFHFTNYPGCTESVYSHCMLMKWVTFKLQSTCQENLLEMSGGTQIKDNVAAKVPGQSPLTLAGKRDLYSGASSQRTRDITAHHLVHTARRRVRDPSDSESLGARPEPLLSSQFLRSENLALSTFLLTAAVVFEISHAVLCGARTTSWLNWECTGHGWDTSWSKRVALSQGTGPKNNLCLTNWVWHPFLQGGAAGWEDSSASQSCGSIHVTVVPKILQLDVSHRQIRHCSETQLRFPTDFLLLEIPLCDSPPETYHSVCLVLILLTNSLPGFLSVFCFL